MKSFRTATMCAAILAAPALAWADTGEMPPPAAPMEEPAAEKEWSFSAGFDITSEYIFRGVRIPDNDPLWSPSASFAWKGFSVWYWGGFGDSEGPDSTYEENDYGIDYTHAFMDDKLSITVGALMYHYPDGNSGADTFEVYASAGYDMLLQPSVSLYWDVDEFHGGYLTFGIGHSFDLGALVDMEEPMAWSLDPSAALSIDLGYNDRSTSSNVVLNDILLGLSTTIQINEMLEVHAGINYSISLDALNNIGLSDSHFYGGAGFSVSF